VALAKNLKGFLIYFEKEKNIVVKT